MNIQPLNRHVLVEVNKAEEQTSFGIVLPESGRETFEKSKVVAKDPSVEIIEVGQTAHYKLYALSIINVDGKEYGFLKEDEILAVED